MELLELEDGNVALGSLGMSDGFLVITDGTVVAQSEPGDWKMLAIWATFDEGKTELRILSLTVSAPQFV